MRVRSVQHHNWVDHSTLVSRDIAWLRAACRERGIYPVGSVEDLVADLEAWAKEREVELIRT